MTKQKQKPKTRFVTLSMSLPLETVPLIKRRCRDLDTDVSKFMRGLVRKDLKQAGVEIAAA